MREPKLARQLTLEARQAVADGLGGFSESWQMLGTLWAEVVAGIGREVAGEEVRFASIPYRITVRGSAAGSAVASSGGAAVA
jgi:head-tail adaptor